MMKRTTLAHFLSAQPPSRDELQAFAIGPLHELPRPPRSLRRVPCMRACGALCGDPAARDVFRAAGARGDLARGRARVLCARSRRPRDASGASLAAADACPRVPGKSALLRVRLDAPHAPWPLMHICREPRVRCRHGRPHGGRHRVVRGGGGRAHTGPAAFAREGRLLVGGSRGVDGVAAHAAAAAPKPRRRGVAFRVQRRRSAARPA